MRENAGAALKGKLKEQVEKKNYDKKKALTDGPDCWRDFAAREGRGYDAAVRRRLRQPAAHRG